MVVRGGLDLHVELPLLRKTAEHPQCDFYPCHSQTSPMLFHILLQQATHHHGCWPVKLLEIKGNAGLTEENTSSAGQFN